MEKSGTQRWLLGTAVVILAAGILGYFAWSPGGSSPPAEGLPALSAPAPSSPSTHYPVAPPSATDTPLPALDASDAAFGQAVARLFGLNALPGYVLPDQMIRRLVATIDNLPRAKTAAKLLPVRPVAGRFEATGAGEELAIAPRNAARYRLYVTLVEQVDATELVELYLRWYPLFQRAYVELGYPRGHFNDRLVETLDDLLQAPEPPARVALAQPHVLYEFSVPELEELSAGQKILVRMGSANAARVKAVLQAIRDRLVARTADPGRG